MSSIFNKDIVIKELDLHPFGSKGWYHSSKTTCPNCGTYDKFGVYLDSQFGAVHCFKADGYSGSLVKYLREIGRGDLLKFERSVSLNKKLEWEEEQEGEENELREQIKPLGFRRIYFDEYLDERGFTPFQYNYFRSGISSEFRLRNYIVFLLYQEGKCVGWLARSKYDKEWHEENMKRSKLGLEPLVLRYRNSENTDFDKILLGIDEINDKTERVYLVEGLFDKSNTDTQLQLYSNEREVCCCTFGNKISDYQIDLLRRKGKSIKHIISMYDYGTITQTQNYGLKLGKVFDKVSVAEFFDKNIDPGNATREYFLKKLNNLKDIFYFYKNRIGEIQFGNIRF